MINPLEYLPLAKELITSDSNNEAKLRTSMGRSYYAAFLHAGQKYLQLKNNDPIVESTIGSHQGFIRELKESTNRSFQKIGNKIADLKRDREKADYRIKELISKNSADTSYKKAISLIALTEETF